MISRDNWFKKKKVKKKRIFWDSSLELLNLSIWGETLGCVFVTVISGDCGHLYYGQKDGETAGLGTSKVLHKISKQTLMFLDLAIESR